MYLVMLARVAMWLPDSVPNGVVVVWIACFLGLLRWLLIVSYSCYLCLFGLLGRGC